MSDRALRASFKGRLEEIIKKFLQVEKPEVPPFEGGVAGAPHEHATRVNLLDSLIEALGWRLSDNEDVVEEARIKDDTTNFIDYLGVSQDRKPILIVEAKAWDKPSVRPSPQNRRGNRDQVELLQEAMTFIRTEEGRCPVIKEWHEWLVQVRGYVSDLKGQGHDVSCLVITSGQWMVIFKEPVATLYGGEPVTHDNVLIIEFEQYVERSDEILEALAKDFLAKQHPPYYRPSQLSSHISAATLNAAFLSLILKKEKVGHSMFELEPMIHVYPSLLLLRNDGEILRVALGADRCTVPHNNAELAAHLTRVRERSDVLVTAVQEELQTEIQIKPITEFPGFNEDFKAPVMGGGFFVPKPQKNYVYVFPKAANEFLVATGTNCHYLLPENSMGVCRFHDWTECQAADRAFGASPILVRNMANPASFFISGEEHHCAHVVVHDRRDAKCQIAGFEESACCKACAFESVCWSPAEKADLPCGH